MTSSLRDTSKFFESHKNFRCSDNLPQLVRAVLASVPTAHDEQEEAPEELYFPTAHGVQEEEPEEELYFPGAHLAHEDIFEFLY